MRKVFRYSRDPLCFMLEAAEQPVAADPAIASLPLSPKRVMSAPNAKVDRRAEIRYLDSGRDLNLLDRASPASRQSNICAALCNDGKMP
jgi:hypothetical protein